jgi:hypothetical protein
MDGSDVEDDGGGGSLPKVNVTNDSNDELRHTRASMFIENEAAEDNTEEREDRGVPRAARGWPEDGLQSS